MCKKKEQYCDPKISADPQGSYTGVCDNPYEEPVQDADDL